MLKKIQTRSLFRKICTLFFRFIFQQTQDIVRLRKTQTPDNYGLEKKGNNERTQQAVLYYETTIDISFGKTRTKVKSESIVHFSKSLTKCQHFNETMRVSCKISFAQ